MSRLFFARNIDGNDPESRLESAESISSQGDTIILKTGAEYSNIMTFPEIAINVIGLGGIDEFTRTTDGADWSFDSDGARLSGFRISGSVTINGRGSVISEVNGGSFTVTSDQVVFTSKIRGSVMFEDGTKNGIVDSSTGVSVTDNGNNTVGDIA